MFLAKSFTYNSSCAISGDMRDITFAKKTQRTGNTF